MHKKDVINKRIRLFLGMDSLAKGNGGIAMVSRLMVKFLNNTQFDKPHNYKIVTYGDRKVPGDIDLPIQSLPKSKIRYIFQVQKAIFGYSHFIYDFAGLARAHRTIFNYDRPFLTWIHGVEVWENARSVYAKSAKRATVLVSNSAYTLKRAQKIHGPFAKARICWLSTETDEPTALKPPSRKCATVSIVGRIDKQTYKGHYPLIQCWPEIVAKVPNARLQIVGDGPGKYDVQRAVDNSPVANRIIMTGFVPEDQMENIWKQTKIFAMPSRGEGFGIVYIEAMRHCRPVIASIHDAAQEINIEGQTGYNVNLDAPGQLANRIIDLLTNHDKAVEMGMRGMHRWKRYFCFSAFCSRFLPIYNEFIQQ